MKIYSVVNHGDIVREFYDKTGIKPNIMISYTYHERNMTLLTKTCRDLIDELFLDSGAFSVFTGKKNINRYEYLLFLRLFGHLFTRVITFDDKFDDAGHNFENQLILEDALKDKGIRPIPVVHDFENPYKEFEMYVRLGHDYIGLGSMGSRKSIPNNILGKIRTKHPKIKVHKFGTLNQEMLLQYRPESADSSGWAQHAGKGGSVYYWRPSENKRYEYNVGGKDSKASEEKNVMKCPFYDEIVEFWMKKFNYTPETVVSDAGARQIINLYFNTQFEAYLNSPEALTKCTTKKATQKKGKK